MIVVGREHAFERIYMGKFRSFTSRFGEFVSYENDRGARDLGLHLTHKLDSGKERLSTALCWFQLKGIMSSTLSKLDFNNLLEVKVRLEVSHLQYWYLQPMPTYLVLYIECVDKFLVINIQDYIERKWGKRILSLEQSTATVYVPKESVLDNQAFQLILKRSDLADWSKVIEVDIEEISPCYRDYEVIWHLGTAEKRRVSHSLRFLDWQSKLRSEIMIEEYSDGNVDNRITIRKHYEYRMSISDLAESFPYLDFDILDESEQYLLYDEDDDYLEYRTFTTPLGDRIYGEDKQGELIEYNMRISLNELGEKFYSWVNNLLNAGLLEISPGEYTILHVAPWNKRLV